MDADRFDAFSRSLLLAPPRRAAVVGALGAGLAALIAGARGDDAEARKKRRKRRKKCKGGKKRCGRKCRDLRNDPNNCGSCGNVCATGDCLNGTCTCDSDADCAGCTCAPRKGSGKACLAEVDENSTCQSDADCPDLGSFCTNSDRCSISCKE